MRPSSAAVTYSAVKDQLVSLSLEIEVRREPNSSSSSIGVSVRLSFRMDGVLCGLGIVLPWYTNNSVRSRLDAGHRVLNEPDTRHRSTYRRSPKTSYTLKRISEFDYAMAERVLVLERLPALGAISSRRAVV